MDFATARGETSDEIRRPSATARDGIRRRSRRRVSPENKKAIAWWSERLGSPGFGYLASVAKGLGPSFWFVHRWRRREEREALKQLKFARENYEERRGDLLFHIAGK